MFDLLIESSKKALESIRKWRDVALRVKKLVQSKYPDAKVYVFGSCVEGRFNAMSDIDVLVVKDGIEKDYALKSEILEKVDAPLELHFVNERQFREWYLRFIDKMEEI